MSFNINPDAVVDPDKEARVRRSFWDLTPKVVLSRTSILPASPVVGDIYIIRDDDLSFPNQIAFYYDLDWHLLDPTEGWVAYVVDDDENVQYDGAAWDIAAVTPSLRSITFVIDGGGTVISTGIKGDLQIPFACTILSATLLADQTGSIVVDIWKDTYANYPPVVGDSITASAKPTITTNVKSTDATLTGWTTSIADGDVLRYNVDSASSVERVTLALKVQVI